MGAAWRGCGTMRRGAGLSAGGAGRTTAGVTATGTAGRGGTGEVPGAEAVDAAVGGAATGGAAGAGEAAEAVVAGEEAGGVLRGGATGGTAGRGGGAAASSRFCWIALRTSPGFETRDQSIFGFAGASAREAPDDPERTRWKWARTRSASSSSSELECVFFSVTPTSSSTSRIALLFTSSSRAKSLIRTLLIRPFYYCPAPLVVHINLLAVGLSAFSIMARNGAICAHHLKPIRWKMAHTTRHPLASDPLLREVRRFQRYLRRPRFRRVCGLYRGFRELLRQRPRLRAPARFP
jgi:hypothetical protein